MYFKYLFSKVLLDLCKHIDKETIRDNAYDHWIDRESRHIVSKLVLPFTIQHSTIKDKVKLILNSDFSDIDKVRIISNPKLLLHVEDLISYDKNKAVRAQYDIKNFAGMVNHVLYNDTSKRLQRCNCKICKAIRLSEISNSYIDAYEKELHKFTLLINMIKKLNEKKDWDERDPFVH